MKYANDNPSQLHKQYNHKDMANKSQASHICLAAITGKYPNIRKREELVGCCTTTEDEETFEA